MVVATIDGMTHDDHDDDATLCSHWHTVLFNELQRSSMKSITDGMKTHDNAACATSATSSTACSTTVVIAY